LTLSFGPEEQDKDADSEDTQSLQKREKEDVLFLGQKSGAHRQKRKNRRSDPRTV